ncbi:hypothetical protein DRO57_03170 [Candidatus Bathyarchaeota archaeon]|nr:MAG: hypothetical protein DRO57_03170 [Candidatus Bathyarchaeota archaeon]
MAGKGLKVFGHLLRDVVKPDLCTFCGACVTVCPVRVIDVKNDRPVLTGRCILCQLCYNQCPKTEPSVDELEKVFFGLESPGESPIGSYKAVYTAEATDEKIRSRAASGGVVTALLKFLLEEGMVDCATVAVADVETGWKPRPEVVFTGDDVLKAAGSKYTYCPMLLALGSAYFEYARDRVAFVGTPCQVTAVRKMQLADMGYRKLGLAAKYVIGLFCMENFDYSLITEFLPSKGVDLKSVSKFDISGGAFKVYGSDGKELLSVKVKELEKYSRKGCMVCPDLTAELADISVGNIGSSKGMSTVIVRTSKGEELFNKAVEKGILRAEKISDKGLKLLLRIAERKRKRGLKMKSV